MEAGSQQLPAEADSLCLLLHPKVAQHNRPVDCSPAASHATMAAAQTVNILPGNGFFAGTPEC